MLTFYLEQMCSLEGMQLSGTAGGHHSGGFLGKRRAFSVPPVLPPSTSIHREPPPTCMYSHTDLYLCTLISVTLLTSLIDHAMQCHASNDFTNEGIKEDSIMEMYGNYTNVLHISWFMLM